MRLHKCTGSSEHLLTANGYIQSAKALMRLHECTGSSEHLLAANGYIQSAKALMRLHIRAFAGCQWIYTVSKGSDETARICTLK